MNAKKLIVALALLLSATSATLAKTHSFYDYSSGVSGAGSGYNPATSGYDPSAETQR